VIRRIEDRDRIRDFCRRDPGRFAFHLGDLDDVEWPNSHFFAKENRGIIEELVLAYLGLSTPSVQLFGARGALGKAALKFLPHLPERFHLHFHIEDAPVLERELEFENPGRLLRMRWDGFPREMKRRPAETRLLSPGQLGELLALLQSSFAGIFFEPRQLEKALFSGAFLDGRLVACAGFHVLSQREGVGVFGNIATLPEMRGRGLAAEALIRLIEESRDLVGLLALNVHETNTPALALYGKLGFNELFRYQESLATSRHRD